MAVYNLARGGYAFEFGAAARQCSVNEQGLPLFLQGDNRADGGYGYRDKIEWKQLLKELDLRYKKSADDLQVGDQLYIFLQPNHSNLKSLFVDFRENFAGFQFELKTLNGVDLTGKQHLTTYSERMAVEKSDLIERIDMTAIEPRSQWTMLVDNGYNAKVDAVVLEIKALPKNGNLAEAIILFARRFEMDGYMM